MRVFEGVGSKRIRFDLKRLRSKSSGKGNGANVTHRVGRYGSDQNVCVCSVGTGNVILERNNLNQLRYPL